MVAGRPRTVSLPPNEMELLGKEMVEWVKLNQPFHLSAWYCRVKMIIFKDWETMRKKPEFVIYYEQAMQIIGEQYLDKDSKVREGASQRWQRVYFKDLAKEEDDKKQKDIDKECAGKIKVINHQHNLGLLSEKPLYTDQTNILNENMHLHGENSSLKRTIEEMRQKLEKLDVDKR